MMPFPGIPPLLDLPASEVLWTGLVIITLIHLGAMVLTVFYLLRQSSTPEDLEGGKSDE